MTFHRPLLAAIALAAAVPAFANTTTTLSFDGVTSFDSVADTYLASDGLRFTGAALGLQDDGGAYSHAPSGAGIMFVNDAEGFAVLSTASGAGFAGQVSFYFSNATAPVLLVRAYAGDNGTGAKLGEYGTFSAYAQEGCSDTAFCNWQQGSFTIKGVAKSLVVYSAGGTGYDNLSVTTVPEPATYAMLAAGLLALGFMAQRRKQG